MLPVAQGSLHPRVSLQWSGVQWLSAMTDERQLWQIGTDKGATGGCWNTRVQCRALAHGVGLPPFDFC